MWNNSRVPGKDAFITWLDSLQASGRYTFTKGDAEREGPPVERKAIWRAQRAGRLVQPRNGFFVIVPAEYRAVGAPPPAWFIDALMRFEKLPYYVGLLSAASLYGASPQAVQEFQVIVPKSQRPITIGRLRIRFVMKSDLARAAVIDRQTPTGTMRVSAPEQTAFDLVQYADAAGGWDNLAAVLAELAPQIHGAALARIAAAQRQSGPMQRLGYLLELVGALDPARALAARLKPRAHHLIPLDPRAPSDGARPNARWRLLLNRQIERD